MRSERTLADPVPVGEILAAATLVVLAFFSWTPLPVIAVGVVCAVWRPGGGGWFGAVLLALAAAPLLALLPVPGPAAWAALLDRPGISLTPQPRVLLAHWPAYLSAVGFLWWISGRMRGAALIRREGAVLAAAAVISCLLAAGRWDSGDWRGPTAAWFVRFFETRNLAAGFAAVTFAGCALRFLRTEGVRLRAKWGAACVVSLAPLLALGSRGAMAAAILGAAFAGMRLVLLHRRDPLVRRRIVLWGALVVLLAAAGPAVFRVPLRDRLSRDGAGGLETRAAIQRDAWGMAIGHAATGVGLGSFEDVFPMFRVASASQVRVRHPESDWLWLVCESGLLTGLLASGTALVLARRCWRRREEGVVGLAALVAVLAHGLLDVPAHSLPVIFLAAALAGGGGGGPPSAAARLVGVALVLAGVFVPSAPARPAPFAPARPMVPADPAAIRLWLGYRPLDSAVLELALHQSIAEGDNARARSLMERVFRLEPFAEAPAARAFGVLARRGNIPLASLAAQALLDRADPGRRSVRLAEILDTSPPVLRREILARTTSPDEAEALALAAAGDFENACRLVLRQVGPTDEEIQAAAGTPDVLRLALQEIRDGRSARARAILHASAPRLRHSPEFWYLLGRSEYELGDPREAWKAFEIFTDLTDGDPHGKTGTH